MTESPTLGIIDFLTHSKVLIRAGAATVWPFIVDVSQWRTTQSLVHVDGDANGVGGRFHAVSVEAPGVPLFNVENVEMVENTRRTIRLDELDGRFIGFASWELTPADTGTVVAYDVYCRGAMLPPGQPAPALLATAQKVMDEGMQRLKSVVESWRRGWSITHQEGIQIVQNDSRYLELFKQAEEFSQAWLRPGTAQASTLSQLMTSPDGRKAVGAASVCEALEGMPSTRIALVDLDSGDIDILTHGPRSDSAPQWSPDGRSVAYLSDREQTYVNRLRILDLESRTDRATPNVDGFVEYLRWSADGKFLLLGVAGYGSDLAGVQGAISVSLASAAGDRPAWAPEIEGPPEATPWRSVWLYDVVSDTVRRATPQGVNVWQATWCGPDRIAAICSDQPQETRWYSADVRLIDVANGATRILFKPQDQLSCLSATPSGETIAVVEAVCSDRNIVAGNVRLIDVESGTVARPSTLDSDVIQLSWRNEDKLLFAAAHGPETVVGLLDRQSESAEELWRGCERTPSGFIFPEIAPLGSKPEDLLFLCESFFDGPVLIALESGKERVIRRLGTPETDAAVQTLGSARDFRWTAPDGLTIHGWLLTPSGPGPRPLIMLVHGGPVWYYRPLYVGRLPLLQMALAAGYAVFLPNPRGSSGRGQDFARLIFGDMGGGDTHDYLSGLDALEKAGLVDPKRIGVTGTSYGGYISSWLITQDQRFAASVPVAPVTDWVSEHLTCNVPSFCQTFLNDEISNPQGKYFHRSPVHHAHRVVTPTLHVAGALDKITPPGQALEFHRAVRETGTKSVLLIYPGEGHGIRNMPASFDYLARTIGWFQEHMPSRPN